MGKRWWHWLGGVALLALAAAGLWAGDKWLTRPGRAAYAQRVNDLMSVRDELLRYQYEWGELPPALADLTPGYLRPDQLEREGAPRYCYDRQTRTVALAAGQTIRGLVPHHWPAQVFALPRPQEAGRPQAPAAGTPGPFLPLPGPVLAPPPAGAFVFEAEHYSELNYGWEVHPDPGAGGGAWLHAKEGIGNGPGQTGGHIFNFHDIREGNECFRLRYHFRLPKSGRYYLYGRLFTTGSHCSNQIVAGIDRGGPLPYGGYAGEMMHNETPFEWLWTPADGGPRWLEAGDHFLHLYLHEDGMRLDQLMLSPTPVEGAAPYAPNLEVNAGTAFAATAGPPVDLTFDLKTMVFSPGVAPEVRLVLRRLRPASGLGRAEVILQGAGPQGADLLIGRFRLDLDKLPPLALLPLDFSRLDVAALPRREYLLQATLREGPEGNDKVLATGHSPMLRPCAWQVSKPLPFLSNDQPGPLDGGTPGEAAAWTPFAETNLDPFGVLDFGLQTIGNSLHAPENATIYARTVIHVPAAGTYLLKLQSDDQMRLWLDDQQVYRHDQMAPVTRSVMRLPLVLSAGEHRLRIRVNNCAFSHYGDGRWQASLRFRTREDLLAPVTGCEP